MIEGHVRQLGLGIKVYDTIPGLMLYSFNMPLFFFVSGLLAYKINLSFADTCKKIWQKFVFLVVPAIIFKIFNDIASHHNPFDTIYTGFGRYWFTITLFECFLLYYSFILIFRRELLRLLIIVIVALAGVGVFKYLPTLRIRNIRYEPFYKIFSILCVRCFVYEI